jgi:hypothetical protein
MGEVDFLVNLNTIRGHKFCWKMIVKKLSGGKVSSDKIRQVAKAVGIIGNSCITHINHSKGCKMTFEGSRRGIPLSED